VSLDSPLDAANPLTAQVVLSNDGMLPLEGVSVASFINQANYEQGSTASGNLGTGFTPNNQTLDIGRREISLSNTNKSRIVSDQDSEKRLYRLSVLAYFTAYSTA